VGHDRENLKFDPDMYEKEVREGLPHASLSLGAEIIHPHAIMIPAAEVDYWLKVEASQVGSDIAGSTATSVSNPPADLDGPPHPPPVRAAAIAESAPDTSVAASPADNEPVSAKSKPARCVPEGHLRDWYTARKESWPLAKRHPSADEDLVDAREAFKAHLVSRDMIRTLRRRHAPAAWTYHGRRKLAQE
jgi:hypothetical protein